MSLNSLKNIEKLKTKKNNMRKLIKIILVNLVAVLYSVVYGQDPIEYTYDDAGNRIKREHNPSPGLIINNNNNETTAMEDLEESGVDLDAHPNPTAANTTVTVLMDPETISEANKSAIESGVTMQLADINGKTYKTQKGTDLSQTFDLLGMAKGVYFVKVYTEDGQLVGERKIVKE